MEQENNNTNKTSPLSNFEPNIIGAFAYLFPFITGIIFYAIEKDNKFIRFHAIQSVLFWLVLFVVGRLVQVLDVFYIGYILNPFIQIGGVLVWLLLMWKAYQKEEFELPYIGKIAKDQANK